jgi:phage-related protein
MYIETDPGAPKETQWIGSSQKDLREMPEEIRDAFGYAIWMAQCGDTPEGMKPLHGFGGGVLEVIATNDGGTYRAVYTVRFSEFVYVLHVFQKKSKRGSETPKHDIELIRSRLKIAERHHAEYLKTKNKQGADS